MLYQSGKLWEESLNQKSLRSCSSQVYNSTKHIWPSVPRHPCRGLELASLTPEFVFFQADLAQKLQRSPNMLGSRTLTSLVTSLVKVLLPH